MKPLSPAKRVVCRMTPWELLPLSWIKKNRRRGGERKGERGRLRVVLFRFKGRVPSLIPPSPVFLKTTGSVTKRNVHPARGLDQ